MPISGETPSNRISGGLFNDILAGILAGEFPPKAVLPTESRLANDYGVSRTVVRSALDMLKQLGVVESRQGSGTVVATKNTQTVANLNREAQMPELKDCYGCRLAIEPEIAAIVANTLPSVARTYLEEEAQTLHGGDEDSEYERCVRDADFHSRLAEYSGNSFLVSTMTRLRPHILFAMNSTKTLTKSAQRNHVDCSRREHLEIITAILARDSRAARASMRAHIKQGGKRIFQQPDVLADAR